MKEGTDNRDMLVGGTTLAVVIVVGMLVFGMVGGAGTAGGDIESAPAASIGAPPDATRLVAGAPRLLTAGVERPLGWSDLEPQSPTF
jgi:hypothetical protein